MNSAIKQTDYKKYLEYCNENCLIAIDKSKATKKKDIHFLKGEYKGFIYIKKLLIYFNKTNKYLKKYELYNHLKMEKSNLVVVYSKKDFFLGIEKSINRFIDFLATPEEENSIVE